MSEMDGDSDLDLYVGAGQSGGEIQLPAAVVHSNGHVEDACQGLLEMQLPAVAIAASLFNEGFGTRIRRSGRKSGPRHLERSKAPARALFVLRMVRSRSSRVVVWDWNR